VNLPRQKWKTKGMNQMNQPGRSRETAINDNRIMRYLFLFSIFLMALTGFGQMPIYKRYYMSDIPGFGWLANFYTTRYAHYLGAALLLALLFFFLFDYFFLRRNNLKITKTGYQNRVAIRYRNHRCIFRG
jgi:cell division protein FtsW (lipid II flippase)